MVPPALADPGVGLVPRPDTPFVPAAIVGDGDFDYGIVFAVPLVLAAFGGYFAAALSKPTVVDRKRLGL